MKEVPFFNISTNFTQVVQIKQGMDLIDLRQILREMAGADFLASEATAASEQPWRSI